MRIAIDAAEFAAALKGYLSAPGDDSPELVSVARQLRMLPMLRDWSGCLLLREDGEICFREWDSTSHDSAGVGRRPWLARSRWSWLRLHGIPGYPGAGPGARPRCDHVSHL
jgi:hypothetical protein